MQKIINLKPEEEVTSVVEYLWETGADEVYLIASQEASLIKNIIALKLLKREAERLGKTIILVTKSEVGREMAKRAGLASRVIMPKIQQVENEFAQDEVLREVPSSQFESMLEREIKIKRKNQSRQPMSDIRPKETKEASLEELPRQVTLATPEEILPVQKEVVEQKTETAKVENLTSVAPESSDFELEKKKIPEEDWFLQTPSLEPDEIIGSEIKTKKESLINSSEFFAKTPKVSIYQSKEDKLDTSALFKKIFFIFIGAAVLIVAAALYFILPKTEINVSAKTEPLAQDLNVTADKGVTRADFSQKKIPAQLIKLDKKQSQEFSATGQRQLNEKAKGIITIYNEYSSSPQALVEKTRFVSEKGKVFRTTKLVVVPGAKIQEGKIVVSSIEVGVVADQAGEEYNIDPSNFTIPGFEGSPKYKAFYGRSKEAMVGGASGLFRVVAQDDYDNAKNGLWQSLRSSLDQELKAQIPSGFKAIDGALKEEIASESSTVEVGGQGEKFTLTIKGTASVLLFDEKDILTLFNQGIAEKIKDEQKIQGKASRIDYQIMRLDFAKGQLSFKAKIDGKMIWQIDAGQLKKEVVGKNEDEVRNILTRHSEIDKAQVIFWPFWVKSVPTNSNNIKVKVE